MRAGDLERVIGMTEHAIGRVREAGGEGHLFDHGGNVAETSPAVAARTSRPGLRGCLALRSSGTSHDTAAVLIGILSDSHGRLDTLRAGVEQLQSLGAKHLIHCGDLGDESSVDLLAGTPSTFVFGNNDFDRDGLAKYAALVGVQCGGDFVELELDGKRIAVTHGDNARLLRRLHTARRHDYLFYGHTHVFADERAGTMRVINPGALYRAAQKTVATLDLLNDELKFHRVDV